MTTATATITPSSSFALTPNGTPVTVSVSGTAAASTIWQNGVLSYTVPYPAGDAYHFLGPVVNDNGWVVDTTTTNNQSYAVAHGFVWENGTPISLGSLGGGQTLTQAINDAGQVIGTSSATVNGALRPFVWQNGVMTYLPSLSVVAVAGKFPYSDSDAAGSANAINSSGVIVGSSSAGQTASHQYSSATMWKDGQPIDLGTLPGGGQSTAYAINDAGQVIGTATLSPSSTTSVAVTFQNGAATLLPGLAPNGTTMARDISNSGIITGYATTATGDQHAVMWQNGAVTDLNTLLPANSGWVLSQASGIDAAGEIMVSGTFNGSGAAGLLSLAGTSAPLSLSISASAANLTIDGSTTQGSTVSFSGKASDYAISTSGATILVTDTGTGRTSTDHLTNVTALHFSDVTDIIAATPGAGTVTTGNITEIYGAVFGRLPDVPGLAYYQAQLTANPAIPLLTFAQWFLASPEYTSAHSYAQSSAGDDKFITDSYSNLLKRPAEAAAVPYYENVVNQFTQGLTPGTSAYAAAQAQGHALVLVYLSASQEFLGDVQITAQNPSSPQHWLLLH